MYTKTRVEQRVQNPTFEICSVFVRNRFTAQSTLFVAKQETLALSQSGIMAASAATHLKKKERRG